MAVYRTISPSSPVCLILVLILFIISVHCDWRQHHRYRKKGTSSSLLRNRRQSDNGPAQVDLNITVPFIFSARLYPYGQSKGDKLLESNKQSYAYHLKHDFMFYGQNYSTIYIGRDGVIGFESSFDGVHKQSFPNGAKLIAVYWTPVSLEDSGRVYFREAEDDSILQLAGSEVQIQYHFANDFKPKSVFIVTWENVSSSVAPKGLTNSPRNVFQAAFILGENETFAHFVYSKLRWHNDAVAGFNAGDSKLFYNLPGSNTGNVMKLANDSDIGIPGEWLFKLDDTAIHLCGPGFKGLECVDRCKKYEYYYDCVKKCHCNNNEPCHLLTGNCPQSKCAKGWQNPPVCDTDASDEDECLTAQQTKLCTDLQPDCINAPGSYVCTCLTGFDNSTNTCLGHVPSNASFQLAVTASSSTPSTSHRASVSNSSIVLVPNFAGGFTGGPQIAPRPQIQSVISKNATTKPPPIPFSLQPPKSVTLSVNQSFIRPITSKLISSIIHTTTSAAVNNITDIYDDSEEISDDAVKAATTGPPKAVLPPGIPFFSTSATTTTTAKPLLCDLQCTDNSHCEFHRSTMKCVCNRGWSGDGTFCVDINECFLDNVCEPNAKCQNTIGSYNCLCEPGFQSNGKTCVDIDECNEDLVQCPGGNTSVCVNTPGSFECRCKNGYNGNPVSVLGCIDINECLIPEFYCGPNADCENTPGNFRCHCHSGYQRNADATDCEDIDECKASPCSGSAVCRNSPGSFSCTCQDGYSGDGFICQETILYPFSRTEDKRLPQERNAIAEIQLPIPVKLFGKDFTQFFVSANGIITFDRSLEIYSELPVGEMRRLGFAPLYQKVDLTRGGGVYVKVTTEYLTLARASNYVHEEFHEPDFHAKVVFIITFDDVIQLNQQDDSKRSTFQTVVAAGELGTYVTFIYDRISNDKAQIAIVAPEPPRSVVLPQSGNNATIMKETSNIQIPGKWMYRVDEKLVLQCPAGYLGPPYCLVNCDPGSWGQACSKICQCADSLPCDFQSGYCSNHACLRGFTGDNCQQDIDECAIPQRLCHPKASCINTIGSFTCKCQLGWTGDGFHCTEITPCLLISGIVCGENAGCFVPSNGSDPRCICNSGFSGDGRICSNLAQSSTTPISTMTHNFTHLINVTPEYVNFTTATTILTTSNLTMHSERNESTTSVSTSSAGTSTVTTSLQTTSTTSTSTTTTEPQTETEWTTSKTVYIFGTTKSNIQPSFKSSRSTSTTLRKETTTAEPRPVENVFHANPNNRLQTSQHNRKNVLEGNGPTQMLVIIIPAVLCGIWLLLIVVLFIVCVRRRKQKQKDKYGTSYYLPATNGAVLTTAVNPTYNVYGSQWSIHRPAYDFYKAYYPDYYSAYNHQ